VTGAGPGDPLDGLLTDGWAAAFQARCAADAELCALAARSEFAFRWGVGTRDRVIAVDRGLVTVSGPDAPRAFSIAGPPPVWRDWLQPVPPPGRHDVMALWVTGAVAVDGDQKTFAQHLVVTRRLLELARACVPGQEPPAGQPGQGPSRPRRMDRIAGRYLSLDVLGRAYPVYYEEAGEGPAVVFLHTAAADARQYHPFLADPAFAGYRLLACDLPFHGRSTPTGEWWTEPYQLTQEFYASFTEEFCDALGLSRPVLVGASMGAQLVLELSIRRPGGYRAVLAFGPTDYVGREAAPWLHHPEVNETLTVPAWIEGMAAPQTSAERRHEIRWVYSQSGAGVFAGDGNFFLSEWDIRGRLDRLDAASCPVFLFAGEYDYSRPPESVRKLADRIPGATYIELPGCGHFPMTECPERVTPHLLEILAGVAGGAG